MVKRFSSLLASTQCTLESFINSSRASFIPPSSATTGSSSAFSSSTFLQPFFSFLLTSLQQTASILISATFAFTTFKSASSSFICNSLHFFFDLCIFTNFNHLGFAFSAVFLLFFLQHRYSYTCSYTNRNVSSNIIFFAIFLHPFISYVRKYFFLSFLIFLVLFE